MSEFDKSQNFDAYATGEWMRKLWCGSRKLPPGIRADAASPVHGTSQPDASNVSYTGHREHPTDM
jgi:hypothetical protein